MILFHGLNQEFDCVDLSKSKDRRDFGKGFYTTTIKEQALQWGYNMFNRFGGNEIFLYEFEFLPSKDLVSKQFSNISNEWFDFILSKRLMYSKANDQVSLHTQKAVSLLKLRERRKTLCDKIIYNGQEISFLLVQKTEHIVSIIADKENISFDSAYSNFSFSGLYKSLQNPASLLWAENAEFIVDEYYREKLSTKGEDASRK